MGAGADPAVDDECSIELFEGAGALSGIEQRLTPEEERFRFMPRQLVTAEDLDGLLEMLGRFWQ